jgi:MurNAc alpha-1-phosphate uridylyltransferase
MPLRADPAGAKPRTAMVLAAGLGLRMRPLTETLPKPLIRAGGKALVDHGLDALAAAGVGRAVVNVHYLADRMEAHLARRKRPEVAISDERAGLLDSGGGVVAALPLLGARPFYLLNADTFWIEGASPNLDRLADFWDGARMDILLLVAATAEAVGYDGRGDFDMDAQGRLSRRAEGRIAPFAYAGAAIVDPAVFADAPRGAFSLNRNFDAAAAAGRLFGLRLEGLWLHVGTPAALRDAETAIASRRA